MLKVYRQHYIMSQSKLEDKSERFYLNLEGTGKSEGC